LETSLGKCFLRPYLKKKRKEKKKKKNLPQKKGGACGVAQKKKEILRQIYLLEGTTLKLHFFYLAAVRFELRASGLRLAMQSLLPLEPFCRPSYVMGAFQDRVL
jgi:hypothetical protein